MSRRRVSLNELETTLLEEVTEEDVIAGYLPDLLTWPEQSRILSNSGIAVEKLDFDWGRKVRVEDEEELVPSISESQVPKFVSSIKLEVQRLKSQEVEDLPLKWKQDGHNFILVDPSQSWCDTVAILKLKECHLLKAFNVLSLPKTLELGSLSLPSERFFGTGKARRIKLTSEEFDSLNLSVSQEA